MLDTKAIHAKRIEWILNCPSLIVGTQQGLDFITASEAMRSPQEIKDYQVETRLPLGSLYEDCIAQCLKYPILQRNTQVSENSITLGEVDFLINMDGKPLHLEVAIKFYIEIEPGIYIGPNGKDSLALKLKHIIEKQSRLLELHHNKIGLDSPPAKACLLQGMLFHHIGLETFQMLPSHINPKTVTGAWLWADELGQLAHQYETFHVCTKHDWITESECHLSFQQIEELLETKQLPIMLQCKTPSNLIRKIMVIDRNVMQSTLPH